MKTLAMILSLLSLLGSQLKAQDTQRILEKKANETIPQQLYSVEGKKIADNTTLKVKLLRNGPIKVTVDEQETETHIETTVPIKTKDGSVNWSKKIIAKISHHEDFYAALVIHIKTDLIQDQDGNVVAHSKAEYRWITRPFIKLLGQKITFGKMAGKEVQKILDKHIVELDRFIMETMNNK